MNIVNEEIEKYIDRNTSPASALLERLDRDTHAHVLMPGMLSGHVQGRVLSMLSKMIRPKYVLEIGTFTGYSAICFAEGLQEGGKIITLDINEELESMVRKYFREAGVEDKIDYRIGNALHIIPTLDIEFDLVFIDADKVNYPIYYELVIDKVKAGGYILADNILWKGKVVNEDQKDKDLSSLLKYNKLVHEDVRVENIILPVRDGLMLARKLD